MKVESGGSGCVVKIAVKEVAKEVIPEKHVGCGEGGKDIGNQGCGSGSAWIRNNFSCWIRIQEGKNDLQI